MYLMMDVINQLVSLAQDWSKIRPERHVEMPCYAFEKPHMSSLVMLADTAANYTPMGHVLHPASGPTVYWRPVLVIAPRPNRTSSQLKNALKARKPPRLQKFKLAHRLDAVRLRLRPYGNLEWLSNIHSTNDA